jgi:hypothetical protein
MAAGDACANCKFAKAKPTEQPGVLAIICRREPPRLFAQFFLVPNPNGGGAEPRPVSGTFWPQVTATDWCGEHAVDLVVAPAASLRRS